MSKINRLTLPLALAALAAAGPAVADLKGDEAAIRKRVEAYTDAFNRQDLKGVAAAWAENAAHTDRETGERKEGREAILADKLLATVINPSGRIHGGAIWAGYLTVSGTDMAESLPKFIRTDGGPIVKDTAAGYIWLHDNMQY